MGKGIWQYHTLFRNQAQMNVSQMLAGLENVNVSLGKKTAPPFSKKSRRGRQAETEADAEGTEAVGGAADAASRTEDAAREDGQAGDGRIGTGRVATGASGERTGAGRAAAEAGSERIGAGRAAAGADGGRAGAGRTTGLPGAGAGHACKGRSDGRDGWNVALPNSPEMLRQAVVWSEVLGEPVAKRRRRERGSQKQCERSSQRQ